MTYLMPKEVDHHCAGQIIAELDVFGAMVIGIISNGLNLIGVSSYWQLIIKGLIIACAVLLDCQKDKIALLKNKVRAAK